MAWAASALAELCDRLDNGEEPTAALVSLFSETRLELAEAVDRRIAFIKYVEGAIEGARAARNEWDRQKTLLETMLAAMKARTKEIVETYPDLPYAGSLGKLAVQKNGGKAPVELAFGERELSREIIEMFGVPEHLIKITYTLDTDKLRRALEAGEDFPWATLQDRGSHLRIKAATT